ncbi:zf-TFIIB domain-containing protein [Candidatus Gottesmanbacteria bacterium]|nr:zf-TFIIB domain-containing protein [Candidatus Gottesmanbacteria bacterium]
MFLCPNRDGFLKTYTTTGKNGLPLTYHRCPHCRGFWLSGFAANFLMDTDLESAHPVHHPTTRRASDIRFTPLCPECKAPLHQTHGDNIPAHVTPFRCTAGHGYFFPAGELSKFKTAQQAKIAYHKLWNIPLPSVASILLASLAVLLVSITAMVTAIRQKQSMESQAQSVFKSQTAFPSPQGTVLFVTTTNSPSTATLFVPSWNNYHIVMDTTDGLTHTTTVSTIPPGTYRYFFTITINGKTVQTEMFEFSAR